MLSAPSRTARLPRLLNKLNASRAYHDVVVLPGKRPIVGQGPPGRSAIAGSTVTVFGCTGFLGRYLVSKIAKSGTQVVVPYRDEDHARHLRPMGDLGQIVPMEWDIRNEEQIAECIRHSDVVYNLVGRDYETKNFSFDAVNVEGAARIARVAKALNVPRLVHVSHLNASTSSPSHFYATKALGEEAVREAFPDATIVRPGALFGFEDHLLNNIANWPIWWKLNHAQTKIRPAHVLDVAQALSNVVTAPAMPGTYSLPGPSTLTYEYLLSLVQSITYRPASGAPTLPKSAALFLSKLAQNVWWPALSPDEVERRYLDDVETPGDWAAFGVDPTEIEPVAITYLRRYRSAADFSRPVVFPPEREHLATSVPHSPVGL